MDSRKFPLIRQALNGYTKPQSLVPNFIKVTSFGQPEPHSNLTRYPTAPTGATSRRGALSQSQCQRLSNKVTPTMHNAPNEKAPEQLGARPAHHQAKEIMKLSLTKNGRRDLPARLSHRPKLLHQQWQSYSQSRRRSITGL